MDDANFPEALFACAPIQCALLPHPGLRMTRPSWAGGTADLDSHFRAVLDAYLRRLLDGRGLQPKRSLAREISSSTLGQVMRCDV